MEYMTIQDAARKWQVSELVVQHYCATRRIPGALHRSGVWSIPARAPKPADPEQANAALTLMPLLNTSFPPGSGLAAVEGFRDPHARAIARAEYAYFQGRAEDAAQLAELYLSHPDLSLRLSACLIYAYANLTLERPPRTRMALEEVRHIFLATDETAPPSLRAAAAAITAAAAVLLHLPLPEGMGDLQQYLPLLPPGLRMFSLYVQAHHAYLLGGMLEAVLKKDWPEDFKRIINITYQFSSGWRKIHNPSTGHDVADNLTTTEFAVAMLAARDWSNQEIAAHLGISTNTVKHYLSSILQKLNIKQRKDLRQYMLL